ncbi:aminodeoxychorismate synthase component I [Paraferrimonas sp. SM1919]|uniref:aminodeoxychorismate synthase component I n=1 Tax=Paraferrimonas sp. SM1919 TaxID=2662263 RepID=UPI0013D0DA74|nr:aminodeoxychorismate synthase component I [Paraferrimonas sp. SM1919]
MTIALHTQILKWQDEPHYYFAQIAHLPWATYLSSANAEHIDARYDIISADPRLTIESYFSKGKCTSTITHNGTKVQMADNPFQLVKHFLNQVFPIKIDSNLPFSGGVLGQFGYDLGRAMERIDTIATADIDAPVMAVGMYDWAIIVDHQLKIATMVHYGDQQGLAKRIQWLQQQQGGATEHFALTSKWHNQISKQQYLAKFNQVQNYLASGDCYQINLTQRFSATYQGDEWQAYQKLSHHNSAPFSAFIRHQDYAILSISPERFLQVHKGVIETKPIKGTRPRHQDPITDAALAAQLQSAPKDNAENLMIVDLLRNDLGRVAAAGSVTVPKLFDIESFPAVHHLVSTVRAKLDSRYHPIDALAKAFPGGSITGAPKIRAMNIIEELEPSRRHIYCGSIGYISQNGDMDTSITIRTLIAEQGKIHCWAGGGIVVDSDGDEEYQESYDKVAKILPILESNEIN